MSEFLKQLDTPGGHVLMCLLLVLIGTGMWLLGVPKSEDVYIGAVMVLFGAFKGNGAR